MAGAETFLARLLRRTPSTEIVNHCISSRSAAVGEMLAANMPFDPTEHEAVVHEPGGGGDPVVAEVLRTGYRWKGKVLRPAMVKVKD